LHGSLYDEPFDLSDEPFGGQCAGGAGTALFSAISNCSAIAHGHEGASAATARSPSRFRHPELVSGPISLLARRYRLERETRPKVSSEGSKLRLAGEFRECGAMGPETSSG
jgi:hypothetical protein